MPKALAYDFRVDTLTAEAAWHENDASHGNERGGKPRRVPRGRSPVVRCLRQERSTPRTLDERPDRTDCKRVLPEVKPNMGRLCVMWL